MKNTGTILGALLIGAALGAVAGILLAPDKGSETRKKLMEGSKDLAGNLKNKFMRSAEKVEDFANEKKENLEEFYHNVHSASNPVATA
ncbi:hypothetical protein CNR22_14825 [Sphingobacteriaceae bacterium]|nr:hypothetical protein CNR22_14825 [Sphingobacteriaceae bacterium]